MRLNINLNNPNVNVIDFEVNLGDIMAMGIKITNNSFKSVHIYFR